MAIKALDRGNLSVQAYTSIREALIDGGFAPGERLIMHELAERLGTSVTPVREACLRLVSEQGLVIRSGRFVMVPELDLARYLEIRAIRIELEGLAARKAANHATPQALDELDETQERFSAASNSGDAIAAVKLNRQWHFGVYRLSRMSMLVRQIESLWISMGPILKVYHEQAAAGYLNADEHVNVVAALRDKDGARAEEALCRDIERGGKAILAYLSTHAGEGQNRAEAEGFVTTT